LKSPKREFLQNHVKLFARMKPLQKEEVVNLMKDTGETVGMCGDGANDCAALAAAHCGVALSTEEASVVSPFSGASLSINAVVELVREGRACLVNAFVAFKFVIIYGIIEACQTLVAFNYASDMTGWQYISIDYLYYFPAAFFTVRSMARPDLKYFSPTETVFGWSTLSCIIGQSILGALTCVIPFILIPQYYPDYTPSSGNAVNTYQQIPETAMVYFIGSMLYPAIGLSLTLGSLWREPFYYNIGNQISAGVTFLVLFFFLFFPPGWNIGFPVLDFMQFPVLTWPMRKMVLLAGVLGFLSLILWEYATIRLIQWGKRALINNE